MALVSDTTSKVDLPALAVLALLSERDAHPYEIARLLKTRHQGEPTGHGGRSLYHAVARLAAAGFLDAVETSREGRRPERTVYRITQEGREELRFALSDLIANPRLESSMFAAALARLGYLSEAEAVMALEVRLARLEGLVAHHQASVRSLRERTRLPRLFLLEEEYLLNQLDAEIHWVTATVEAVRSGELAVEREWLDRIMLDRSQFSDIDPRQVPLAVRDWEAEHRGGPGPSPEPRPRTFRQADNKEGSHDPGLSS